MSGIVFVTVVDLSIISGSGVATREIIRGIVSVTDEPVIVLCPEPKEKLPEMLESQVDEFIYLPTRTNPGSPRWHLKTEFSILRKLGRLYKNRVPSLVVTRLSPSTLFPALFSTIFNIPHILLIRGWVRRKDSREDTKFGSLVEQLVKMNVRLSDEVYVAFDELKEWVDPYRSNSKSPVKVLPNAVDPDIFSPQPLSSTRAKIGIDAEKFVVGFVGSLAPRHELKTLFRAAAKTDDVYLLIVGDGVRRNSLDQLAADLGIDDRVTFTGQVDHEEVPKYISSFDVGYGVVSSDKASNPIKCYEYLSCERPVITSQKEEFEFISKIDAGVLVSTVSTKEVYEAIEYLRNQPRKERLEMGKTGRSYVQEHFTWKRLANELIII
ncbi:glycosyltransferase family 4 protein [Halorutilales archaeon Cl-col2-1]